MEWNISINKEELYAEINTSGTADTKSSLKMAQAIASELSQYKISKVLIDHSNIEKVTGNDPDIYSRPKEFQEIGNFRFIKIAEIIKPEHKKHFEFLELVLVNRGFNFSVFYDRASALKWLMK